MSPIYHAEVENQEKETKKHRKWVPFKTRLSRGHCNDSELEEGQGIMNASVGDPTQAPGRHPQTHANCKSRGSRS